MTIGAVIVAHNSKNYIALCVNSLIREGIIHIVVVDSASTDATLEKVRALNIATISLQENKGFGSAANIGMQTMNTDYVLLINPDAYLETGAIQSVKDLLNRVKQAGVVGVMLQDVRGKQEEQCFGKEPSLIRLVTRKFQHTVAPQVPFQTGWVSGGAMVVDRELFTRLGGFDEDFFLYWEDVDICKRVREAGYTIWLHPQARSVHARGASQEDAKAKTRLYDTSADRYYKKHYPISIWLLQRILRKIYRLAHPEVR